MPVDPRKWTREILEKHSLDMRQFMDFRPSTLPNGMRIIEAYNSSGLSFTLLPDRGMDIWTAHYKGIPLTWISPGSPHPPDFGQSWLRQFNGGLLTTCGLTHVGPPEVDTITGEQRDIHGNYTRLRAQESSINQEWYERPDSDRREDDDYLEQSISATIYESSLFGAQIKVDRIIWQSNEPDIGLADRITNMGDEPVPLMLLYHINLGFPVIQSGTHLYTPHEKVYPRDAAAAAGYNTWQTYESASAGYSEQVFFHHLRKHDAGEAGLTRLMIVNQEEDFGLSLTWDTDSLPYFTQWKNTRQGIYVCGIEPGNCIPEGQNAARQNGRLQMIQPGETIETYWCLGVLDGADKVQQYRDSIDAIRFDGIPVTACKLDDYAGQLPQG